MLDSQSLDPVEPERASSLTPLPARFATALAEARAAQEAGSWRQLTQTIIASLALEDPPFRERAWGYRFWELPVEERAVAQAEIAADRDGGRLDSLSDEALGEETLELRLVYAGLLEEERLWYFRLEAEIEWRWIHEPRVVGTGPEGD
jgi:hypothetical protein